MNTATVLAKLDDLGIIFCGSVGEDDIGRQVKELMVSNNVKYWYATSNDYIQLHSKRKLTKYPFISTVYSR